MLSEYLTAIIFYAVFSAFALIGLAIASRWISDFKTAYIASKPLGLLVFGYAVWLASSLKLFDFQNTLLLWIFFIASIVIAVSCLMRSWPKGWRDISSAVLVTESFWLILYLAYLWLRAHNAEIHGTERFMDMSLFNASYLTNYFPPIDPWRAGNTVNYYYYGHYLFSLISRLSGILPNFGYTFALGIILSSSIMLAWNFVKRFTKSNLFAVLAGYFVVISGTVAYSFCVLGSPATAICSYMKSTRLYEPSYIINEIPSYSFTVGDLHAHVIALPFFILALIIIYDFFILAELPYSLVAALTVVIGSLGMINSWDFVSLSLVVFMAVLFKMIRSKEKKEKLKIFMRAATMGVCAIILMLPFLIHFSSGAAGIGFAPFYASNNSLVDKQYPTPIVGWLGMWAGFLTLCLISVLILRKKIHKLENFALVLVSSALVLLALVELFFVRDVYSLANPPYFRANTVFKFGFHTWTLLVLSSMVLAAKAAETSKKYVWFIMTSVLTVAFFGFFYPYQAINQFYLTAQLPYSLNGELFLYKLYPDDYSAIQWLKKNLADREVVVEAAGESYSDYGRISVFAGTISPINWLSHEWTWHFSPDKSKPYDPKIPQETGWGKVAGISGDVRQIYESQDIGTTINLLKKYGAKFIYLGDLERKEYKAINESKFNQIGTVVFSHGSSKLYKLNI